MPAPSSPTYSAAAKVAAHTSFRDLLDGGASTGFIKIRSAADADLAGAVFANPCGTVNGATGQLTFTPPLSDVSANGTGTAAYAEFCDGDGVVHLALPCVQGSTPVSGYVVLQTLTIVAGAPVEIVSATIG